MNRNSILIIFWRKGTHISMKNLLWSHVVWANRKRLSKVKREGKSLEKLGKNLAWCFGEKGAGSPEIPGKIGFQTEISKVIGLGKIVKMILLWDKN